MQYVKAVMIFAVGVAIGAVGGGYLGYGIGSSDPAIDRAPRAAVIPVQPARPAAPQQPEPAATPAEGANAPSDAALPPPSDAALPPPSDAAPQAPSDAAPPPPSDAAPPPPSDAAPQAPSDAVPVSTTHRFIISPNDYSSIMWVGYKSVLGQKVSMKGGFANFEGTITVENGDPARSLLDVTVDINSTFSVNSILTSVLKDVDFFNVAEYPSAHFVSTQVESTADGYLITGNFTLRGVTQGLQFPATIEKRDDGLFATAEFIIDRKLWNVGYDLYEDSLILGEVVVQLEILAEPA